MRFLHKIPVLSLTTLSAVFVISCGSQQSARIANHKSIYQRLDPQTQKIVESGSIAKGFSKDAVFLAWGQPARKVSLSGQSERWDYVGHEAVQMNTFGNGHGSSRKVGVSSVGGFGFGPDIAYIPTRVGSVYFKNNKVENWEKK